MGNQIETITVSDMLTDLALVAQSLDRWSRQCSPEELVRLCSTPFNEPGSLQRQVLVSVNNDTTSFDETNTEVLTASMMDQMRCWFQLAGLTKPFAILEGQVRDLISAVYLLCFETNIRTSLPFAEMRTNATWTLQKACRRVICFATTLSRLAIVRDSAYGGMPPALIEEDWFFLQAARELGAENHCVPTADIHEQAEGSGAASVRSQLERLQAEGLLVSKRGMGSMLTPKASRLLNRQLMQKTPQSPHLEFTYRRSSSRRFLHLCEETQNDETRNQAR